MPGSFISTGVEVLFRRAIRCVPNLVARQINYAERNGDENRNPKQDRDRGSFSPQNPDCQKKLRLATLCHSGHYANLVTTSHDLSLQVMRSLVSCDSWQCKSETNDSKSESNGSQRRRAAFLKLPSSLWRSPNTQIVTNSKNNQQPHKAAIRRSDWRRFGSNCRAVTRNGRNGLRHSATNRIDCHNKPPQFL